MNNDKRKEAWRFVLSSNQGREVIRDILVMSGDVLNSSPFTGATNQTIKQVGMQDVGRLVIGAARTHAPENWIKLQQEDMSNE